MEKLFLTYHLTLKMKIVYNNVIPFPGYKTINLFGVLFVRKGATIDAKTINHESIHTAQMKEMLYIFFYLWYAIEYIIIFFYYLGKDKSQSKRYHEVGFEEEAYAYESDMSYLANRKHYSWLKYINLKSYN